MKTLLTSALLLLATFAFAQTPAKTPATTTTAQTGTLTPKAQALCKEWVLTRTENFGDQHNPTDKQKGDKIIIMADGKYRLVMEGVVETGSWSLDKSNVWLTLTADGGAVKKFKILEQTATSLKVDYRDQDDIHNVLFYAPASGTQQR